MAAEAAGAAWCPRLFTANHGKRATKAAVDAPIKNNGMITHGIKPVEALMGWFRGVESDSLNFRWVRGSRTLLVTPSLNSRIQGDFRCDFLNLRQYVVVADLDSSLPVPGLLLVLPPHLGRTSTDFERSTSMRWWEG